MLDHWEARIERRLQLVRGRWARWRGARVGARFGLGKGVCILYPSHFSAGHDVTIEEYGYIHSISKGGVHVGDNTSIARNLWLHGAGTTEDPGQGGFEIGEYSFIGCNAVIGSSGGIRIGSHVQIGPNVTISSENHVFDDTTLRIDEQGVVRQEVLVSDNCWIASNVTILAGVILGEGCVVAAGAVVTNSMPACSVVAGIPAKIVRIRGQVPRGQTTTSA